MTRDLVYDFLREEGYAPKIDDDGDLIFKAEGRTYIYFGNENDQDFFQLAMPGIFDVTDENRETVLEACNYVTRGMKVAKACIMNSSKDVWLFFEILLDNNPQIGDFMPRAINILRGAQQSFYEQIRS